MIEKNTDKLYVLPDASPQRAGTEITSDELADLVSLSGKFMDESVREAFAKKIQDHVGPNSTYKPKASVLQGLKVIYDKFKDANTNESEKKIIAIKLEERARECTPGFHNGVNAMVDSFYSAKSVNDLLYRVRNDIVSRTANQLTDEVHTNNRVFVVAEDSGYGVHALNREDSYLDHMSGAVPKDKIKEALKNAFEKELNLFPMLQGLEDQLRGQLDSAGYAGQKDTVYPTYEQAKIKTSLKQLFKDASVVIELQAAQTALDEQDKAKKELTDTAKKSLKELELSFNERELSLFLNPESAKSLPQLIRNLAAKVGALDVNQQESLKNIKSKYIKERDSFGTSARDRLTEANQAFETKFFIVKKDKDHEHENEGITDINWPNLREMIWQRVNEQQYFNFTNGENVHLDALMNPKTPREAFNSHFKEMLNLLPPQDTIQLLNHFHLSDDVVQENLSKYAEKLPVDAKYDFFAATLRSLDNTNVKNEVIKRQHKQFIAELKNDIPTLLRAIPLMSLQETAEYLKDETLQSQLLKLAILEHPQCVKPLMDSLATLPEDIQAQILGSNKELLITAAEKGQIDVVKALLASDKIDLNETVDDMTALVTAAVNGHAEVVTALLADKSIKLDEAKDQGLMALFVAAATGHLDVVEVLLADPRIDPIKSTEHDLSALTLAAEEGHTNVVKVLLKDGRIDPNQALNGETALMSAASSGCIDVVTALLEDPRIAPNQVDKHGKTALMLAASRGHADVVSALLKDPRVKPNQAITDADQNPFFTAVGMGYIDVVKVLLADGRIDPSQAGTNGQTVLNYAVAFGRADVVTALLEDGRIDPNKVTKDGETTLMLAVQNGRVDIVKALLLDPHNRINPNQACNRVTPLMAAILNGKIEMVESLLDHNNIDPNQAIREVVTPLAAAIAEEKTDVVKALVSHKKTVLNPIENKMLPILIKSIEIFDSLLKDLSEEKTKIVLENSHVLLHQAFLDGKVDFFEALIDRGMKPTEATLSQIYLSNNIDIISILINKEIVTPNDVFSSAKLLGNIALIQGLYDKKLVGPTKIESLRNAVKDDVKRSKEALLEFYNAVQAVDDVDASFNNVDASFDFDTVNNIDTGFDNFDTDVDNTNNVNTGFDNFDEDFDVSSDESPKSREENLKIMDDQSEKIRAAVKSALENYDKVQAIVREMPGGKPDDVTAQALAEAKWMIGIAQDNLQALELALLHKAVKAVEKDVQRSKVALEAFLDADSQSPEQAGEVRAAVKSALENYDKAQAIAKEKLGSELDGDVTQALAEAKLMIGLANDNLKALPKNITQNYKAELEALQRIDSPQETLGQDKHEDDADKFNP